MFTCEQDALILMVHFRSGIRNEDRTWTYSLQSCIEQYLERFPNENISYETFSRHKNRLVERFQNKQCICKEKSTATPTVLSVDIVDDIQHRIEQSATKCLPKLSAQADISYGSCQKALKRISHMHPYKIAVVQQLYPRDHQGRIQFCQWFSENSNNNNVLDQTFMSNGTWFYLSGYVNSQNYRTWGTKNPHTFIETSLHPIKIGAWVALSTRRIVGSISL